MSDTTLRDVLRARSVRRMENGAKDRAGLLAKLDAGLPVQVTGYQLKSALWERGGVTAEQVHALVAESAMYVVNPDSSYEPA